MLKCEGDPYQFELLDNAYLYETEARLIQDGLPVVNMYCSLMMGRTDGTSWSCTEDTLAKASLNVVVFGQEWEQDVSAKLFHGPRLTDTMSCKAP